MLRIEVKSNQDKNAIKSKITAKHTYTGEAIYLMAIAYKLIKENDETGITEKEIFKDIKDMVKELDKQDKGE